mmetsp:Transcript_87737/g.233519  ORF Transcript_87737/g.233519 Transcript_87737/m.233519 type:complete len:147 (-) Transcript_87737:674-1114(-)
MHCEGLEEVKVSNADIDFFSSLSNEHVIVEGTLEKRGYWNTAWKQRYFVIDNKGRMLYFKSKEHRDAGRLAGMIALINACSVSRVKNRHGKDVCFELRVPANGHSMDRTFHLCAPSEEMCEKWVYAIEGVKDNVHYMCFPRGKSWW